MPVTFTFDLSQQQFELRCGELVRRLVQSELVALIQNCEELLHDGHEFLLTQQKLTPSDSGHIVMRRDLKQTIPSQTTRLDC